MRSDIKAIRRKVLMLVAATSSILIAITMANAQGGKKTGTAANTPFTGVWQTVAGSATRYTVRLTQIGAKVTGTYSPRNGKIFGGVVTGNKLTFKWTQDGGYEGTAEFILDDDRKGFTGSSTAIKPAPATNPWKTYKPDPPSSFAGTWETKLGSRSISLSISQKGDKVTGTYPDDNGTIEGSVLEKILRFKWESDAGSGSGQFRISTSGRTFSGWFNKGDDPDVEGTRWEGSRTSGGKENIGGNANANADTDTGGSEIIGGSGGKTAASFAGFWGLMGGGSGGGMDLAQLGSVVTGFYGTNQRSYDLRDATVNGTILRFKLVARDATGSTKIGEVVMDPGGKSFKGNIGGIPVTGTLGRPL